MALKTVAAGETAGLKALEAHTVEIQTVGEAKPLEIVQTFQELLTTPARFGQGAVVRQMEVFSALTKVRSPQDLFELQSEHGRKAFEAYAAEIKHTSELFGSVVRESTRALSAQASSGFKS